MESRKIYLATAERDDEGCYVIAAFTKEEDAKSCPGVDVVEEVMLYDGPVKGETILHMMCTARKQDVPPHKDPNNFKDTLPEGYELKVTPRGWKYVEWENTYVRLVGREEGTVIMKTDHIVEVYGTDQDGVRTAYNEVLTSMKKEHEG